MYFSWHVNDLELTVARKSSLVEETETSDKKVLSKHIQMYQLIIYKFINKEEVGNF